MTVTKNTARLTLNHYIRDQKEFSEKAFGLGKRTVGIAKHIEKECAEIREKPDDLEEWVDVIILGIDGYWRAGGTDLLGQLFAKLDKNIARQWPEPVSQDEPVEHVRD